VAADKTGACIERTGRHSLFHQAPEVAQREAARSTRSVPAFGKNCVAGLGRVTGALDAVDDRCFELAKQLPQQ